ncbi:MAG TPA: EscU/YscU/HrcU family type III secretion system export apparatus switch protein [Nocardioides sp.]|uniref:EscU/YscU/HrcU family type III secretion system export apparatus switch protein n=1 Tax=Nocardioides sp. TaxID=35761 RepID=UPI002ED9357D
MAGSSEKTEKPTPKRRAQARKEGQIARSPDIGGWLPVFVLGLLLVPMVQGEARWMREFLAACVRSIADPSVPLALHLLVEGLQHAFLVILALSAGTLLIAVGAFVLQGGLVLSPKLAKPKLSKLDPIQGFKRLFGPQSLWEGAKVLFKSLVLAAVSYSAVRSILPLVGGLVPIDAVLSITAGKVVSLLRNVAIAALVMAAADYLVQRRRIDKQTRMSMQDIKDEHKQSEGDPLVKSAIRSRQLAAARNRMIADVAEADVLLVNPTHVAVALRYDPTRGAPRVVARGAGAIAAKIREAAVEARVPLVRDVPLARALYRHCEVGQEIPRELWAAVAQVLAYVISRRKHGYHGGEHRTPRADDDLPAVPRFRRPPARPAGGAAADSAAEEGSPSDS